MVTVQHAASLSPINVLFASLLSLALTLLAGILKIPFFTIDVLLTPLLIKMKFRCLIFLSALLIKFRTRPVTPYAISRFMTYRYSKNILLLISLFSLNLKNVNPDPNLVHTNLHNSLLFPAISACDLSHLHQVQCPRRLLTRRRFSELELKSL